MVFEPRVDARNRGLPADRPGGNPNYKSPTSPTPPTPPTPKSSSASLTKQLQLNMEQMRAKIGNLAQTNHYFVSMYLSESLEKHFEESYPDLGDIKRFVLDKLGYLCSEATLPVSSYATAEVKDNFMGIPQEFAHTRLYTDMDMTFYIDDDYTVLRFFEGWMDYIGGGNSKGEPAAATVSGSIYRRFNFPDNYKIQTLKVIKFERNFKKKLVYNFVNAFPKGLTAVPVSYGPADLLKVTVTFNFDRYVVSREELANIPDSEITDRVTEAIEEYNKNSQTSSSTEEIYPILGGSSKLLGPGFGIGTGAGRNLF